MMCSCGGGRMLRLLGVLDVVTRSNNEKPEFMNPAPIMLYINYCK